MTTLLKTLERTQNGMSAFLDFLVATKKSRKADNGTEYKEYIFMAIFKINLLDTYTIELNLK
ncbi:hypothetical protein Desru_0334 [Desulforamulus ruminis DSM 2154]|uniref:Uncharacterized protein n=1 Tax=Desulforamulus ruminis (strain ATCC 23193 / DSM 2154 / NCIMB 8452 / DL) TaxID=696281 RepID=F6DPF8_DESRL|nr:hypothetical protein Desru_0334 [Desulforamulus ruminis DSM 2154]